MKAAQASMRAAAQSKGQSDGSEPGGQNPSSAFTVLIQSLLREVCALVHDHLLLVTLEAQRAGRNITRMIFAGVVVLLVTGWLALVASAMFWIVADDASWAQAFLAVGLLHVAISIALIG